MTRLLIFALLVLFSAQTLRAQETCNTLEFKLVRPTPQKSPRRKCTIDQNNANLLGCLVYNGFGKLNEVTLSNKIKAYELELLDDEVLAKSSDLDERKQVGYLWFDLKNSAVLKAINRYRIEARKISNSQNVCEPNFVYLGKKSIFGVGPAFLSSSHFVINNQLTHNVTVLEDATIPRLPWGILTKDSLIKNKYFDITVAHEMAHGLMEDLYGLERFTELEGMILERDGHMASITTDMTTAWIEGFAEGFEAFLGEYFLSEEDQKTPYFDTFIGQLNHQVDMFSQSPPIVNYLLNFGMSTGTVQYAIGNINGILADFIKGERQAPIRSNIYQMRGQLNNFSKKSEFAFDLIDIESYGETIPENPRILYAKEGFVAHFVYKILKLKLSEKMFKTIFKVKPANFHEFLTAFLPTLNTSERENFNMNLALSFTEKGRQISAKYLRDVQFKNPKADLEILKAMVSDAEQKNIHRLPIDIPAPPPAMWIEFKNNLPISKYTKGTMDRINLATASLSRLMQYVESLYFSRGMKDVIIDGVGSRMNRIGNFITPEFVQNRLPEEVKNLIQKYLAPSTFDEQQHIEMVKVIAKVRDTASSFDDLITKLRNESDRLRKSGDSRSVLMADRLYVLVIMIKQDQACFRTHCESSGVRGY